MDIGPLFLFLLTSCWAYLAVLYVASDWRWNTGRIAQLTLCSAIGAAGFAFGWPLTTMLPLAAGLFALTMLLPAAVRRHVERTLVLRGPAAMRLPHRIWAALTLRRATPVFEAINELSAIIDRRFTLTGAQRAARRLLLPIASAISRRGLQAARIHAFISLAEYERALTLYREHFERGPYRPNAILLYTVAIACAESGRLAEAVDCVRNADDRQEGPFGADLRPFIARLHVFAYAGRVTDVDRLLAGHSAAGRLLSPAQAFYWQAVTAMHAGDRAAAEDAMEKAVVRLGPKDEALRFLIPKLQARLASDIEPAAVSPDMAYHLDLMRREVVRAQSVSDAPANWRPMVTWCLIIACVAMWVLTEFSGGSTNPWVLMHFGANMPGLTLHGQWWRMVASVFLHVGAMHLLLNGYALYLFGAFVERATGRWGLFATFILSGVAGSAMSAYFGSHVVSAGASGGVFGLLGAAILISLRLRGLFTAAMRRRHTITFLFIAAINMIFGMVDSRVDNLAHGGGFAMGVVCGVLLMQQGRSQAERAPWRLAGFLSALLIAASAMGMVFNFASGGYPKRIPPLHDVISPDRRWKASIPTFWSVGVDKRHGIVIAKDPFDVSMEVRAGRMPPVYLPSKRALTQRHRRIGRLLFLEQTELIVRRGKPVTRLIYQTYAADRLYRVEFKCPTDLLNRYQPLFERLLIRFEISTRATPDAAPPANPAAPRHVATSTPS